MQIRLAWRNLWRNRNRTLITMASVMFAVLLSVAIESLQSGVFDNLINNIVGYYSSYLQVHARGYFNEQTLDNVMQVDSGLVQKLEKHPNVVKASPRVETYALASGEEKTRGCLVTGIVPGAERSIINLHEKVSRGRYLDAGDDGALVGDALARRLKLDVNDTVILLGQGYQGVTAAGKFPVRGLLHFGSPELNENVLFLSLPACREFLGMQQEATTVAIALDRIRLTDRTRNELQQEVGKNLEVITWEEIYPDVVEHIRTDKGTGYIMSMILYLLVSFGIFSTLLMMMAERRFEFGMLLAIGMKKRELASVMIMESLMVTIAGCLTGLAISIPLVYYLKIHPIRFSGETAKVYERYGFEAIFPTSTEPVIFIKQTLIILVISLLLSVYPVYKIFTLDPVNSMKR